LFSISQIPQDSFEAMFTSGLKPRYAMLIPLYAVKNMFKTTLGISKTHDALKRWGSVGRPDWSDIRNSNDGSFSAEFFGERKTGWWPALIKKLEGFSMAADNSVRQAVLELGEKQGIDPIELLEKTYEVINFRRQGSAPLIRMGAQIIPFFNAYLQAMHVVYKTLSLRGITPMQRSEALQQLAMLSAATAALGTTLAMMNADDERYIEENAKTRDRRLIIPGLTPKDESILIGIPLRKGVFLLPKVIAEHVYLVMADKAGEDPAHIRASIKDVLLNSFTGPSLVPQLLKAPVEISLNKNFWTGRAIEGEAHQRVAIEDRVTARTSDLAKITSKAAKGLAEFAKTPEIRTSPLKIDHFIHGMLGTTGHLLTAFTNEVLQQDMMRNMTGLPSRPAVFGLFHHLTGVGVEGTMNFSEAMAAIPGIGGYIKTSSPQRASNTMNDFYELYEGVTQVVNSYNRAMLTDPDAAIEQITENMEFFEAEPLLKAIKPMMDSIRRQIGLIRDDNAGIYSRSEKQFLIRMLNERLTGLMRETRGLIKEARKTTMK
jgi:hypothetical protein